MKLKILSLLLISLVLISVIPITAQEIQPTVCCQETNQGDFCSYTESNNCKPGSLQAPTSCSFTSFCSPGTCIDEESGLCYSGMGKAQCEGAFTDDSGNPTSKFISENNLDVIPECKIGCCIIGTQSQLLTKNRCTSEAQNYGLSPQFLEDIQDEQACIDLSRSSVKGCCVQEDGTPEYTTKANCNVQTIPNKQGFYEGKFCSDLTFTNPICTTKARTGCLNNEDHVYWFDSCGNQEEVKTKCSYLDGTLCGDLDNDNEFTCESLHCSSSPNKDQLSVNLPDYQNQGTQEIKINDIKHGESWCIYDTQGQDDDLSGTTDPPGSRYYRSICISGQEITEPCEDFRKEYCIDASIDRDSGNIFTGSSNDNCVGSNCYTEAACVENRGQSCIDQCNTADPFTMNSGQYNDALESDAQCCIDDSKRDCAWTGNKCLPKVPLGFKHWNDDGANVCAKASQTCKAIFKCGGWNSILGTCESEMIGSSIIATTALGAGWLATSFIAGAFAAVPIFVSSSGIFGEGSKLNVFNYVGDGWHIVESSSGCLTQDFLQGANNICRGYGDCGIDYNHLATSLGEQPWGLTYSGLDYTKSINSEITEALAEIAGSKDGDWKLKKYEISHESLGDEKWRVPGKFQGPPDRDKGTEFIDTRLKLSSVPNGFYRFFFGQSGEFSWNSPLTYQIGVSAALYGLGGFGGLGGSGFELLGTTPLGKPVVGIWHFMSNQFSTPATPTAAPAAVVPAATSTAAPAAIVELEAAEKALEAAADAAREALAEEASAFDLVKATTEEEALEAAAAEATVKRGVAEKALAEKALAEKALAKAEATAAAPAGSAGDVAGAEATATTPTGAGATIGEALSTAAWIYMVYNLVDIIAEEIKEVEVKTFCKPWQAPTKIAPVTYNLGNLNLKSEDQCELCNQEFYLNKDGKPLSVNAFKKCSEYRCKSLGASCELVNQGSEEEKCVSVGHDDVIAPLITVFKEGFSPQIDKEKIKEIKGEGFRIGERENPVKLPIYQKITLGIQTNEPAQCKMSLDHSKSFDEMDETYFGSNSFKYFHTQDIVFPQQGNKTLDEVFTINGEGNYEFFVRCKDARGNANERDYVIEFQIDQSPDLTAPRIEFISFGENNEEQSTDVYLMYGTTTIPQTILFTNEPSYCSWSTIDEPYNAMAQNQQNVCSTTTLNSMGFYECSFAQNPAPNVGLPVEAGDLNAGETKLIYFKCKDKSEENNFNKDPYKLTLHGSQPLNITSISPEGILSSQTGQQNITLQVTTEGGAKLIGESECRYSHTQDPNAPEPNINSMAPFTETNNNVHTNFFNSLNSGLSIFHVACQDLAGNLAKAKTQIDLKMDRGVPQIIRAYLDSSINPPLFTIETDEQAECRVSTESHFEVFENGNLMINEDGKHQAPFNSRIYYVRCKDEFENVNPTSARISFLE